MNLDANTPEGKRLFLEVGGRVFDIAQRLSGMQNVQWEALKEELSSDLVELAKDYHEREKLDPAAAIIEATRNMQSQQSMDIAALNAQRFGEEY